jgi:biotin-dependent carboxylase-like uncharacterized protein
MTELIIHAAGPATTLQDLGRFGWQRYGVGPAGAMDTFALARANMLVGNPPGTAAIELALAGIRFEVAGAACRIAVQGAAMALRIDGRLVDATRSISIDAGTIVEIATATRGLYGYLAVAGGFDLPPVLGSWSSHIRAGLGVFEGRALRVGDHLPLKSAIVGDDLAGPPPPAEDKGPFRVMLGPQDDHFTAAGIDTFLGEAFVISDQSDRMGLRLKGPRIEHGSKGFNIVSDGIATGAIQVPGAGEPLILLADRQTTGGYPKIATVISADIPRLAQTRPATAVRFRAVTRQEAILALRARQSELEAFRTALRPATTAADLSSDRLLALNLSDGFIKAD